MTDPTVTIVVSRVLRGRSGPSTRLGSALICVRRATARAVEAGLSPGDVGDVVVLAGSDGLWARLTCTATARPHPRAGAGASPEEGAEEGVRQPRDPTLRPPAVDGAGTARAPDPADHRTGVWRPSPALAGVHVPAAPTGRVLAARASVGTPADEENDHQRTGTARWSCTAVREGTNGPSSSRGSSARGGAGVARRVAGGGAGRWRTRRAAGREGGFLVRGRGADGLDRGEVSCQVVAPPDRGRRRPER